MRKDHQQNDEAFRQLEEHIKNSYPHGHYLAFMGGQIVAEAADFDELHVKLTASGKNPLQAFIVQAGHVYPRQAVILIW